MAKKDKDREKEFSEYLDKILAGEKVSLPGDIDEDMRSALEFSSEMAEMRGAPSDAFREELKKRLLYELTKSEIEAAEKEKSGRVSYRMLWRPVTVAITVIALGVIGFLLYNSGFFGLPETTEPQPTVTQPSMTQQPTVTQPQPTMTTQPTSQPTSEPTATIEPTATQPTATKPSPTQPPTKSTEITATFSKETYLPGEPVSVEISFTNITTVTRMISPFPPLVEVMSASGIGDVVYRFLPGDSAPEVSPGETIIHVFSWDQRDEQGQSVPFGQYVFLVREGGTLEDSRVLGSIFILPEEGIIEGEIDVNEVRTVGDVTFVLERVELTRSGLIFRAFNTDYKDPVRPPAMKTILAGYSIDGVPIVADLPVSAISGSSEENGYDYVWFMPVPVPAGTQELTFTITRFNDFQGPWEFTIPLK